MASSARFATLSEDDLQNIIESKDFKQTKSVIEHSVNILKAYCESKNIAFTEVESSYTDKELCALLQVFYAEARTQTGNLYAKKSMQTMRYGIRDISTSYRELTSLILFIR